VPAGSVPRNVQGTPAEFGLRLVDPEVIQKRAFVKCLVIKSA